VSCGLFRRRIWALSPKYPEIGEALVEHFECRARRLPLISDQLGLPPRAATGASPSPRLQQAQTSGDSFSRLGRNTSSALECLIRTSAFVNVDSLRDVHKYVLHVPNAGVLKRHGRETETPRVRMVSRSLCGWRRTRSSESM
jgi:hypothetical protein